VASNGGALIDAAAARVHSSRSILADALRQERLDLQQEGPLDRVNLKILGGMARISSRVFSMAAPWSRARMPSSTSITV
jgi:hypothetical protein